MDVYCPFVAPRVQIEPLIYSFHSFMALRAKWSLTPPPNFHIHTYEAMGAKCLGKDTTETSRGFFSHVRSVYFLGFLSAKDFFCLQMSVTYKKAQLLIISYLHNRPIFLLYRNLTRRFLCSVKYIPLFEKKIWKMYYFMYYFVIILFLFCVFIFERYKFLLCRCKSNRLIPFL